MAANDDAFISNVALTEPVENCFILWDSRTQEYKGTEKKKAKRTECAAVTELSCDLTYTARSPVCIDSATQSRTSTTTTTSSTSSSSEASAALH